MTSYDTSDADFEALKRLPSLAPDPTRAHRVRMRCRAQLERSRKRQARKDAIAGFAGSVLVPIVVGGFCVLYMAALVAMTLRFHGILQ